MREVQPSQRLSVWVDLLPYLYPRIKEELAVSDPTETMSAEELIKIAKEKYPELGNAA